MKISFVGVLFLVVLTVAVFAVSVNNSPTACSGQWTNCLNAFSDNTNSATASVSSSNNKTGTWNNYGFSIPNSAIIDSVKVGADFFASNVRGYINVRISGDGGVTFGPSHEVGGNTAEQTFIINVTNDVAWTPSKLNNTNLRVNVTCFKQGSGSNPTCRLDWIPVNVTYTPFDFSVSVNPGSSTVTPGNSAQTNVTVTLLGGSSQNVALSHANCPPSSTCTFNPTSGNPTFKPTFTVATTSSTPIGTYNINITGAGDGKTRNTIYTLTVNSACIRSNPTVLITPGSQNGTAGSTLVYTTSVTNTDSSECGSSTFNMTATIPANWSGSFVNSTLTISPGSSPTTTFSLTSNTTATSGDYTFTNKATNNNAPSFSGNDTAVYHVD